MGGTAVALHLRHRISDDLDIMTFEEYPWVPTPLWAAPGLAAPGLAFTPSSDSAGGRVRVASSLAAC
ncbi:MAG: hypothetical protein OXG69_05805 [bacterium]|nr:hypothetical protein [bacterium]